MNIYFFKYYWEKTHVANSILILLDSGEVVRSAILIKFNPKFMEIE